MSDFVELLRKRAAAAKSQSLRDWFNGEADKIEADPAHEKITRAIMGAASQGAKLIKAGKI